MFKKFLFLLIACFIYIAITSSAVFGDEITDPEETEYSEGNVDVNACDTEESVEKESEIVYSIILSEDTNVEIISGQEEQIEETISEYEEQFIAETDLPTEALFEEDVFLIENEEILSEDLILNENSDDNMTEKSQEEIMPSTIVFDDITIIQESDSKEIIEQLVESDEIEIETTFQTDSSTLKRGSVGNDVQDLQNSLKQKGFLYVVPDGIFGGYTENAIKEFQMYNNLAVTGIADEATLSKLYDGEVVSYSELSKGSTGTATYALQNLLSQLGYLEVPADGIFGNYTYEALIQFQKNNGIGTDGVAGYKTLAKMLGTPVPDISKIPITDQLQKGSNGTQVLALQQLLSKKGFITVNADGIFGGYTERAVKKFQMFHNLEVTGILDESTRQVLNNSTGSFYNLGKGEKSNAVLGLQNKLAELGYLKVEPDGIFGTYTYRAVMQFQASNCISVDGICGKITAEKLFNDPADYVLNENNEAVDFAKKRLDSVGWDLYSGYWWSVSVPYVNYTGSDSISSAVYSFKNGVGDCLGKAATFFWMAKVLGYPTRLIYGTVPYINGGAGNHVWCEIDTDAGSYVCDPDFESDEGRNGYMIYYGQSGTWRYNYGYIIDD